MQDLVPRALVVLHRWLARHPRVHRALVIGSRLVVGERRASGEILQLAGPGDCVWDIGANVGAYTRLFLDRVGPVGHVVAVDPVPAHVEQLRALAPAERLTVVAAALARSPGHADFVVDGEESQLGHGPGALTVQVRRGDDLVADGLPAPDVVKIDVEGFEGEVLDGLPGALESVRGLVVEVHFAKLTHRGLSSEPERIVALLRASGLSVRWLDPSHLLATREASPHA